MRDIEFRGKGIEISKWYFGSYSRRRHVAPTHRDLGFFDHICAESFDVVVEEYSVGEYTGLKDKNDVKIFEGDVVKLYLPYTTMIGKVVYNDCSFHVLGHYIDTGEDVQFYLSKSFEIEVIGNVYDNPELLGG